MIERARLLGERKNIFTAIVLYLDESLFDIDIRSAIFAHGAQFMVPEPPDKVVGNRDLMPLSRQVKRGRPSAITVASQNQYPHRRIPPGVLRTRVNIEIVRATTTH